MGLTFEARSGEQGIGLHNLCSVLAERLPKVSAIVEIGSYCGASGSIIAEHFPNSIIFCTDLWEKYVEDCSVYDMDKQELELKEAEAIFDTVVLKYPNIIKNKVSSRDFALNTADNSIDLIYIDGNHSYSAVKEDLEIWFPKIKSGGYITGHDFFWPSVRQALDEFFKGPPMEVFVDSSWMYYKE
jgi:predicted O-methyltransferase YrrM